MEIIHHEFFPDDIASKAFGVEYIDYHFPTPENIAERAKFIEENPGCIKNGIKTRALLIKEIELLFEKSNISDFLLMDLYGETVREILVTLDDYNFSLIAEIINGCFPN